MNKYESVLAGGIVLLFVVMLIIRAIVKVLESAVAAVGNGVTSLFDGIGAFLALAPPWFWGMAIMIAVVGGLVYLALMAYHSIAKMRNESAIVEIEARRAFVFQNGAPTAVSFDGRQITTRQIGQSRELTPTEKNCLIKMGRKRQWIEHRALKRIEYKGGGCE